MATVLKILICGDRAGVRAYAGARRLAETSYIQLATLSEIERHRNANIHLVAGWGRILTFGDLARLEKSHGLKFTHDTQDQRTTAARR